MHCINTWNPNTWRQLVSWLENQKKWPNTVAVSHVQEFSKLLQTGSKAWLKFLFDFSAPSVQGTYRRPRTTISNNLAHRRRVNIGMAITEKTCNSNTEGDGSSSPPLVKWPRVWSIHLQSHVPKSLSAIKQIKCPSIYSVWLETSLQFLIPIFWRTYRNDTF